MLKIMLPATEQLDAVELHLEHSLVSLHNWEAIHKKPFHSKEPHEAAEMLSYMEHMVINDALPPDRLERFEIDDFKKVTEYINDPQTATTFREDTSGKGSREIITAELIYFWMISFQIPFQPCETWHLNRLMTLIRVAGVKQTKPKRMSKAEQAAEYARLNAERRARLNSTG